MAIGSTGVSAAREFHPRVQPELFMRHTTTFLELFCPSFLVSVFPELPEDLQSQNRSNELPSELFKVIRRLWASR